jgi:predicted AAA+ superfamily ATPase
MLNISPGGAAVGANAEVAGNLLESFVISEIRRQLTWSGIAARVYHYRDRAGGEVDVVLEASDGRVAGIEVKASSAVTVRDAKWLIALRDQLGDRFIGGLVLHTGQQSTTLGPKLAATPLDILWRS